MKNEGRRTQLQLRTRLAVAVGFMVLLLALANASAQAATGPLYDVKATWGDTNLVPGGEGQFKVQVRNIGDAAGSEDVTIVDELPAGVTITSFKWRGIFNVDLSGGCAGVGTGTATCVLPSSFLPFFLPAPGFGHGQFGGSPSGYLGPLVIEVAVDPAASGTGVNTATVSGGGSPSDDDVDQVPFDAASAGFGLVPGSFEADVFDAPFPAEAPSRGAGRHPFEQRVNFDLNGRLIHVGAGGAETFINSDDTVKTVEVTLPRGMIGNPEATPKCSPADFAEVGAVPNSTNCPANTQVGYLNVPVGAQGYEGEGDGALSRVPIYNLAPPKGVAADFAFNATFVQAHIYPELDPAQSYAIKAVTPNISSFETVRGSEVTFWGVPADPVHDKFRAYPEETEGKVLGAPWGSAPIRPLLTNPIDCGFDNGGARIRLDSYSNPGQFTPVEEWPNKLNVSGCDDPRFRFEPEIAIQPSDNHAGAPTGLEIHLQVPQRNDEVEEAKELYAESGSIKAIPTPPMKRAVVTLPEGMTLSPSAAQGLGSCSPAQIGLGTNSPVRCPDNSQYGTLTIHTPILPEDSPPKGFIYIAKQGDNPFRNFLSIYLVVEEPERGILVKVPGRIDLDPKSGQITTTFDDLPQFPVSDLQMTLKGGARAGLVNPGTCGTKTIRAEFFGWHAPNTPRVVKDQYEVSQRSDGSPCVNRLSERPFKPNMEAGTINPVAGTYSPFVFRLTRTDDDQEFSQVSATLPTGLAAKFAGVGICSDAAIAQAERRTAAGDGFLEQAVPSCPGSSQIGTTQVGAGVGVPLTYVPGKVYLSGPYGSAPMSMVVISPVAIGPFDLGVIAVRTALDVNPTTAQATATSDPFPQIFQGIPVRIRDIRLELDRPSFTLNPTSCARKQIAAHVTGSGGDVSSTADDTAADLVERFQIADCASLGFKPRLSFHLFGGTKRGAHPRLRAVLRARAGDANIAAATVALPDSQFLDQSHIRTVCTRVQFAAQSCPAASIYGFASAKTPLFDRPLKGPVYLRSSSNLLPDLVVALKGPDSQPVEIDLAGRIDSVNGGIRNTFEVVPDAPVSEFTLAMRGGRRGLLVNSTNLCAGVHRATAKFTAQNRKALILRPTMQSACGKAKRKRSRGTRHQP
jgi:uncharacterized repeat protein (TIGR01451 family)